jgi:hypothetical protein
MRHDNIDDDSAETVRGEPVIRDGRYPVSCVGLPG